MRKGRSISTEGLAEIAKGIWEGHFPGGAEKFADCRTVGLDLRYHSLPVRSYRWIRVGQYEVYVEGPRADFQRISVRVV